MVGLTKEEFNSIYNDCAVYEKSSSPQIYTVEKEGFA